jgi:hypothetical protein
MHATLQSILLDLPGSIIVLIRRVLRKTKQLLKTFQVNLKFNKVLKKNND